MRTESTIAAGATPAGSVDRRVNEVRRCYDCGFPIGKKARYCPRCGARQRPERIDADRHNHRD